MRLSRRGFAASLSTAAVASLAVPVLGQKRAFSPGASPVRYPDPDLVKLDDRFAKYMIGNTPIQRLHTGCLWAEGPAWSSVGRYLVWSDIPNDRHLRYADEDGHISVMRQPVGNTNGNTFDYQGRLVSCEHGNRRVVRHEHDGSLTVLADRFEGKRFNAPNDVIVHPKTGDSWFTDPGYGSLGNYEGNKGPLEIKEAVYRIDARTRAVVKLTEQLDKPNGLCFSNDYTKLYVADTGKLKSILVFDIAEDTKIGEGREFHSMKMKLGDKEVSGIADGIRCDIDGNIWASAGWVGEGYDGVHVFAPDGTRIGQIRLPEICSNVCFGGAKRNRLFMTGSQSLYAVYVETRGAHIS